MIKGYYGTSPMITFMKSTPESVALSGGNLYVALYAEYSIGSINIGE